MTLIKNALLLAWSETRARYKKSYLGPLWITLGNFVAILGLSVVWSSLLKEDPRSFIPSLTIGLVIWQLLSASISEASTIFIRQAHLMRSLPLPNWFYVLRALTRQTINLLHNLIIVIIVIYFFEIELFASSLLSILGIILVLANLFWMIYLLGILGARYRDIEHIINAVLPLLFFVSPVIFRADRLPPNLDIIWLNPLSYFIEVVRSPIISSTPQTSNYYVMIAFFCLGLFFTNFIAQKKGRQLTFWV
jgi:ABC-type polysaccharide/polyol phosphate export permease